MYGGTFTDAAHTKYTADSAENIKAIQTLHDTKGINFDASIAGGDEITLFRNGTLQMAFCWNIAQQANSDNNAAGLTNDGDEIFPMAFPTESGDPKLCGGIWGFGIFDNGDEAKIEAAKTFIDFIAADPDQVKDSVLASTYFPVRTSVGDIYADNEIMSEYSKFMAYLGDYYQITPGWQPHVPSGGTCCSASAPVRMSRLPSDLCGQRKRCRTGISPSTLPGADNY